MDNLNFIEQFEKGLISNEEIKQNILRLTYGNKFYLISKELFLEELVKDEFWLIRNEIAISGKCLDILVHDKVYSVKENVARHGFGLEILVKDESWRVRFEVARQGFGLDNLVNDDDCTVSAEAKYQLNVIYRDYKTCKWGVLITTDNIIRIGCKTKSLGEWETFFQNKEYYGTDPKYNPEEYQKIVDAFNKAKDFLNS